MKHEIEGDPVANAFIAASKRRDQAQEKVMAAASTWAHDKTDENLRRVEESVKEMVDAGRAIDVIVMSKAKRP